MLVGFSPFTGRAVVFHPFLLDEHPGPVRSREDPRGQTVVAAVRRKRRGLEEVGLQERLDGVVVATNHAAHYAVAKPCLARGVHVLIEKTRGNPFFLNEFLNLLYSENLLHFDAGQQRWQWDVADISSRKITDNVVELLSDKLQRLDDETLAVITAAAAIGSQFDLQNLALACETSREQTAAALRRAKANGLIVPLGTACIEQYWDSGTGRLLASPADPTDPILNCEFKFSHDRLHQHRLEKKWLPSLEVDPLDRTQVP